MALNAGGSGPWNVQTQFNTYKRSDTLNYNISPVGLIPPIVTVRSDYNTKLYIPSLDSDNDIVKCRRPTANNECGGKISEKKNFQKLI
jgi:hypothetical protein